MKEPSRFSTASPAIQRESTPDLDDSASAYQDDFAYALDNRLMLNWYPHRILRLAHGRSMLELGLGHGYSSLIFARHFASHTVIEGSRAVIQQFEASHPDDRLDIRHAYFEDFETKTQYNHIVMGFVLEHVKDPAHILSGYRKFLAPGGSLFVAVPNCEALNRRLGYEAGLIDDLEKLTEADHLLGHQRVFNLESLTELCRGQGYTIGTVEGVFLKPIATAQILKLELTPDILEAMLKVGVNYPELSVGILMELRASS